VRFFGWNPRCFAAQNPYVKLRLSGQAPEWRATKSARGGGIDPKWPLLLDAVQSFPFNFRPTAAFRQLFLEVEVWNEDLDGVDSLMGSGQLDVTNFTKWTCPDSAPLQVDLKTPSGAAAGIIYVRIRSEVKASGPGLISTLSPETQSQLSFLKSVSLFHSFSEEQLIGLTRKVVIRTYEPGAVIVKQGDIGAEFFIVHSGRVSVRKKLEKRSRAPGEDRGSSGGSISLSCTLMRCPVWVCRTCVASLSLLLCLCSAASFGGSRLSNLCIRGLLV
jgi:hypothetical protein